MWRRKFPRKDFVFGNKNRLRTSETQKSFSFHLFVCCFSQTNFLFLLRCGFCVVGSHWQSTELHVKTIPFFLSFDAKIDVILTQIQIFHLFTKVACVLKINLSQHDKESEFQANLLFHVSLND
jgi:hypothetical protein